MAARARLLALLATTGGLPEAGADTTADAQFLADSEKAQLEIDLVTGEEIDAILARGRTPIVAGGSGLYLRAALAEQGVASACYYPVPIHRQPAFGQFPSPTLPQAEAAAAEVLSLPVHAHLSDAQVDAVAAAVCRATDAGEGR